MKPWAKAAVFAVAIASAIGCDPQKSKWGFDAITTMVTPADSASLGCGVQIPVDPLASQRESCAFGSGDSASQTLAIDPGISSSIPIRHLIIMMKENRSFDHLLGKLHDRGQPGVEAVPASYANPDLQGTLVPVSHATTTCFADDPGHQSASVRASIDNDTMDGFVRNAASTTGTDGHFVMESYDETDLPFFYFLAKVFAISDRHFAPVAGGTFANRDFYMFGTPAGVVDTGIVYPAPNTPSLMQLLMNAGFTWGAYTDDAPFSGALEFTPGDPGVHSLNDLYSALDQGTLPNVVFVDGKDSVDDDHPPADVQRGEAWTKRIYDHAIASPQWPRLAIIWTYDEAGGFADHVPPEPKGCPVSAGDAFTQRGPRVPLVAISPWAKRNYVSHVLHDHTAITRLVETLFNLPALTARDANSDALLDLFDFSCGRDLSLPAAPDAGTGGCNR